MLWSTIEPIDLVEKAYPTLVAEFLQIRAKPKRPTKKPPKSVLTDVECNKPTKKTRKKKPSSVDNKNPLIERFLRRNSGTSKRASHMASPKIKTSSTPPQLLDDSSDWMDDADAVDCLDLSNVIAGIVSRTPESLQLCGRKLRFDRTRGARVANDIASSSTPLAKGRNRMRPDAAQITPIAHESPESTDLNVSHFFMSADNLAAVNAVDMVDVFEASIDYRNMPDVYADEGAAGAVISDKSNADFDEEVFSTNASKTVSGNKSNNRIMSDTFELNQYVPVGAKLRKKMNSY